MGLSYKDAAAVAGIGKSTFFECKKRAEIAKRSNKYTVLMDRIDGALQKRGQEYLDAVRKSVLQDIIIEKTHVKELPDGTKIREVHKETRPPDVKAALWWLERRFPEEFGKRVEHSGSLDTGPKTITVELVKTGEKDKGEGDDGLRFQRMAPCARSYARTGMLTDAREGGPITRPAFRENIASQRPSCFEVGSKG